MVRFIFLAVLSISVIGCTEKSFITSEPDKSGNKYLQGLYSGHFTLMQGEELSEGYMEMEFDKNEYTQLILFTSYNSDSLESFGIYNYYTNYVEFNKNLENALMLFPGWFLLGKFYVQANNNYLTLRFQDGYRTYTIFLTKK